MRKTVFLKLPEQGKTFSWVEMDEEGQLTGPFSAEFNEITEHFPNHNVVVLVPSQDVLLTEVELPKISRSKIQNAVAFALEEHLSEDVSDLHFSCGERKNNAPIPVAVVNYDLMGQWFNRVGGLARNGTILQAMIPEASVIPWEENTWTLWMEDDPLLIRTSLEHSCAVDLEAAHEFLDLNLAQAETKPEKIVVYTKDNVKARALMNKFDVLVEYNALEEIGLTQQVQEYNNNNYINMLQADFKPKREIFSPEILATAAAAMIGIWFGILIIGNGTKYFFLNYQANKLDQQITMVYKKLFPKATSVISPRKRVKRLLGSMRSIQTKGAFLNLVSTAGPVVRSEKDVVVQSLTYADSKAQIQVDVKDFTILDTFTKNLRGTGLKVEQSSATKAGETIQAKIELQDVS